MTTAGKMKLHVILPGVLCMLSVSAAKSAPAEHNPVGRPNIICILADDLGYSDLGCYGGEIRTPNIDALARRGVRFTQLYNSARCCPSRASLMTGLYPSQAGIGDFTTAKPDVDRGPGYLGRLNDQCVTLAEVLKPAGYGCYYVGKWHMHEATGPIRRGFDEFYGYTRDHSHDQFDAHYYLRLPEGRRKEIDPPADEYYATDVFNAYALEFIRQGQHSGRPWFLFLGHSSPHFPVQAPAERADKYDDTYLRGWDVLREERFDRMKAIGLVDGERWKLTPRSLVPVDRDDIANGFPGKQNPAWESLAEDRQRDLARRMAVFAAMVETVDHGVGHIVRHLKATGDLDNTLILFLSDNGACYEWGPFGFDGESRRGTTTLRTGDELRKIGGPRNAPVLRQRLGESRQHAVPALQTLYSRRRHLHAIHCALAAGDRHAGPVGSPAGPCHGPDADADRGAPAQVTQPRSAGIPSNPWKAPACCPPCAANACPNERSASITKEPAPIAKATGNSSGPNACRTKSAGSCTIWRRTGAKPTTWPPSIPTACKLWLPSGSNGRAVST